jgi:ribosomal protein S12 methylthiotransferase accessory factor
VTEVNQLLMYMVWGDTQSRQDGLRDEDQSMRSWLETATAAEQTYVTPDPLQPPRTASQYPRRDSDDLLDDVRFCQALVERQGMEVLVLDQTRPDIGLPVVKVIVPGLRHFWPRFAPGRLYDVPVRLGWRSAPLAEDQLNPLGIAT